MAASAQCIDIVPLEVNTADAAIGRVHHHYAEKGRAPKVYAIEVDGIWRKVGFGQTHNVQTISGNMSGEGYEIGEAFRSPPKPLPVETPPWAS